MDEDGEKEIAIKERVHNGTLYNAVICSFFDLNENMIFKKKFVIEIVQKDIFSDCLLLRKRNKKTVIVEKRCNQDAQPSMIGSFELPSTFTEL